MRKLLLVFMLGLVQLGFAATQEIGESALKRAFRVENKDTSGMQISFQLPEYKLSTAAFGAASYQRIEMEGASFLSSTGMPELPFFSTSLAVPATGSVKVEVLSASQRVISGFMAYPVQEDFESDQPKGISVNATTTTMGEIIPQLPCNMAIRRLCESCDREHPG
jgi:hypothetical protein